MTKVSASGWARNSATVGLIAGSSVAWYSLVLNRPNSRSKMVSSALAFQVGRERAEGLLDRGHLALAVLPRRQHGEVHVVPALGQVAPAGRAPVEHGDRVPVGPVEVLAQVAEQLEAPGIAAGLDPGQDVGPGGRLRLEVPPDHRGELVQRLQHREVQLAEEVGGEHQAAMPVDHERFHVVTSRPGALARVLPCPVVRRGPGA